MTDRQYICDVVGNAVIDPNVCYLAYMRITFDQLN